MMNNTRTTTLLTIGALATAARTMRSTGQPGQRPEDAMLLLDEIAQKFDALTE